MTNYINIITQKYPVSEQEIRDIYPNVSFTNPFFAPEHEWAVVFASPQPSFDPVLESVIEDSPVLSLKGTYEQTWKIVQLYSTTKEKTVAKSLYLDSQKALKLDQVNSKRILTEESGLTYAFSDSSGTVQTDSESIRNIQALTTTALILKDRAVTDAVLPFKDLENIVHQMTPLQMIDLGLAVQTFISETYAWAWGKKSEINSATTINKLNGVTL